MTSKSLSPADLIRFQINLLRERMWQLIVVAFIFGVYYIGGSATAVFFIKSSYTEAGLVKALKEASSIMFSGTIVSVVLFGLAIASALLGFSYLYNRQKIDFYEAQPIKRGFRWWNIYINGVLIVLVPFIVMDLVGYIFMSVIGYTDSQVFMRLIRAAGRVSVLYLAVYSIAVLAAMICGNIIIAALGTSVLLGWYDDLKLVLKGFAEEFYATYYESSGIWDHEAGYSLNPIANYITNEWKHTAVNLIIALAAALIAYLIFTKRKNEMTGMAIAFKPLRVFLKIALAVTWTLNVSWIYSMSLEGGKSISTLAFMIVVIIINSILISLILESILSFNIRAAFRNFSNVFIVAMLSLIVYLGIYYDIFGYDSYLPAASNVESYALIRHNDFDYRGKDGEYLNEDEYAYRYMELSDKESVNKLAGIAVANTLSLKRSGDLVNGYEASFLYRLKNGKTVGRKLIIPYNIDASLMNKILGSEEYKNGYFPHRNDEEFLKYYNKDFEIDYYYESDKSKEIKADLSKYEELKKAYETDLKNYDFSAMKDGVPTGTIHFNGTHKEIDNHGSYSSSIDFPVYESFTNTKKFLKDNDLWVDNAVDKNNIYKIEVLRTDFDYDNVYGNSISRRDYEYDEDDGSETIVYDEKDKIDEICNSIYSSDVAKNWRAPEDGNNDYIVYVYYRTESKNNNESDMTVHTYDSSEIYDENEDGIDYIETEDGSTHSYVKDEEVAFKFLPGKIPSFVKEDFAEK